MKLELINNYIKTLPDYKIIIFIDGFDSLINGNLNEAVNRFRNKNRKFCFPKISIHIRFLHKRYFQNAKITLL